MQKSWYAVLTSEVLYDKNLKDKEKILIAIINNLRNETGYCYANNKYLSDLLNCSTSTLKRHLTTLEENGYISRVIELTSTGAVKHRFLTVNENKVDPSPKMNLPRFKNEPTPRFKNEPHNNKLINNKYNKPTIEEIETYFFEKTGNMELSKNESVKFYNYNDSKNWMVGTTKMTRWKSAASNWLLKKTEFKKEKKGFGQKKEKLSAAKIIQLKYGISN